MKKRYLLLIFALFCYLLLCPGQAVSSARNGLLLWYHSILPVLFPFMLLCSLILQTGLADAMPRRLSAPLQGLFGCSANGTLAVGIGFLCGFPMGAKITSQLYEQKKIDRGEAGFLYGFVNNLSPGFITSFLAADQMHMTGIRFLFLANILGAAVLYGILTSVRFRRGRIQTASEETGAPAASQNIFSVIDECIYDSIRSVVRLGGYIVCFSILSEAAMSLPFSEHPALLFLISCIEVTGGIRLIAASSLSIPAKYLLVHALAAFGGLSAAAQTAGICKMDRALFLHYIKSRVMITLLSILLAWLSLLCVQLFFGWRSGVA